MSVCHGKTAVSTCFFFVVFTCTNYFPAMAAEQDEKIASINEGDLAPFSGTLFSTDAAAKLLSDLENVQEKCNIEKTRELSLLRAELQLKIDIKQSEFDALKYRSDNILNIKNDQIEFLQSLHEPTPWYESGEFWFSMGIVGGILITVVSAYSLGQATR